MAIKTSSSIHKQKKRMTSRQLQALHTKDKIYEAALKVIEQLGYKNTSIEAITTAAKVSTGSFYTYFTSKEQILLQTYVKSEELYQQSLEQTSQLPFPENLFAYIRYSYSALEKRGREIMYGVMENILSDDFKKQAINKDRAFYKSAYKLIESGVQSGVLPEDFSVSNAVDKLFIMLTGVEIQWCLSDFNLNLPELAEESIRSLVFGLTERVD